MCYEINYSGFCIKGLVRRDNEDNVWCLDHCLPVLHTDDCDSLSGHITTDQGGHFAVFDGVGGDAHGEMASYFAAKSFGAYVSDPKVCGKEYGPDFVHSLSTYINEDLRKQAQKNQLGGIYSTIVSLSVMKHRMTGFNIGDSRCYKLSNGQLTMLSHDHTTDSMLECRSYLAQCLGMPEQKLEPYFFEAAYEPGDLFLLCSDGLTNLVNDQRIQRILLSEKALEKKIQELKELILKKGAVDNATVLVLEVQEKKGMLDRLISTIA